MLEAKPWAKNGCTNDGKNGCEETSHGTVVLNFRPLALLDPQLTPGLETEMRPNPSDGDLAWYNPPGLGYGMV